MFVGHTAVALAAKAKTPGTSLGVLVAAAILLDLLWPIFLMIGLEHVRIEPGNTAFTPLAFDDYPWTHSLLMAIVWGVVFAVVTKAGRSELKTGVILFALVVSHWVLDFVTHRPDLPLWPGNSPKYGLGLWNSIPAALIIESAVFVAGIAVYLRTTQARDRTGSIAFWALIVVQFGIWVSQPFSPPPPSVEAIAPVGLAQALFVLWAWWIDKHRQQRIA